MSPNICIVTGSDSWYSICFSFSNISKIKKQKKILKSFWYFPF